MTEKDPTGKSAHEPGAKLDAGKLRPHLVLGGFANALEEVIKVGTDGAAKYSDNGWREVENGEQRYMDALGRHLLAFQRGEEHDPMSGSRHLAHVAWNVLAVLELRRAKVEAPNGNARSAWSAMGSAYCETCAGSRSCAICELPDPIMTPDMKAPSLWSRSRGIDRSEEDRIVPAEELSFGKGFAMCRECLHKTTHENCSGCSIYNLSRPTKFVGSVTV